MGFSLDDVVPWGRSYEEYVVMFGLNEADLNLRILGLADGPAGFNAGLTRRGGNAVSVDPLYGLEAGQIKCRIAETYPTVIAKLRENQGDYVWEAIPSIEDLGRIRMAAMVDFLADYDAGKREGRYIEGELPTLSLVNRQFDLALCSHFLFLYSGRHSAEFHLRSVLEMLRVAGEARIFPLLTLDGAPSPHLDFVVGQLAGLGFSVEFQQVPYEFQRGGNRLLKLKTLDLATIINDQPPKGVIP